MPPRGLGGGGRDEQRLPARHRWPLRQLAAGGSWRTLLPKPPNCTHDDPPYPLHTAFNHCVHNSHRIMFAAQAAFKHAHIKPSRRTRYSGQELMDAIVRAYGVTPHIVCDQTGQLAEVGVCLLASACASGCRAARAW